MRNIEDVWRKRSEYYRSEIQKYMRFVFTGHMALVLVFLLGAGGYQYSQWLNANVGNTALYGIEVAAIIASFFVTMSRPITLLKKPDEVYLLPLETKLPIYFKRALMSTFTSQALVVIVTYIAMWPMLRRIEQLSVQHIVLGLLFVIVLKYLNVHAEFTYRWVHVGVRTWVNRVVRFVLNGGMIWGLLANMPFVTGPLLLLLIVLYVVGKRKMAQQPFPYEHFVKLEENRMMGIYRFANYFTDVPEVHGSIKRRSYLDFLYKLVPKTKKNTFEYYLFRSVIRTDDHLFLWVRLTFINALVVAFVDLPIAAAVMSAAFAFAVAIQLKQAIGSTHEFSMSMLYPVAKDARKKAAVRITRYMIFAQALIVLLSGMTQPYFYVQALVVVIVGELTLRLTK